MSEVLTIGHNERYNRIIVPWPKVKAKVGETLHLYDSVWRLEQAYNGFILKRRTT